MDRSHLRAYFDTKYPGDNAADIHCHMCAKLLINPRIFSCKKHTYCTECLMKVDVNFKCPLCLTIFGEEKTMGVTFDKLPTNDAVEKKINAVRCYYCPNELQGFCKSCSVGFCFDCRPKHELREECRNYKPIMLEDVDNGLKNMKKEIDATMGLFTFRLKGFSADCSKLADDLYEDETLHLYTKLGPIASEISRVLALNRREMMEEGDLLVESLDKNRPVEAYVASLEDMKQEFLGNVGARWDAMIREMEERNREREAKESNDSAFEMIDGLDKDKKAEKRKKATAAKELQTTCVENR